ncbi:MAG: hypothetical protein KC964_11955, partial [Candidatus Omnitrophica bacterium]|nr:hypothetical protein [Candidatus Omnitrophota bacterium]
GGLNVPGSQKIGFESQQNWLFAAKLLFSLKGYARFCEPRRTPLIRITLATDFIGLKVLPSSVLTVELPKFAEIEVIRLSFGQVFRDLSSISRGVAVTTHSVDRLHLFEKFSGRPRDRTQGDRDNVPNRHPKCFRVCGRDTAAALGSIAFEQRTPLAVFASDL